MSGAELEALLRQIGWSVGELSRRLGIRPSSANQWLSGRREIPPNVIEWLRQLRDHMDQAPQLPEGWKSGAQ